MKAEKVTVKIEMESLDIATLSGMLSAVVREIDDGAESGMLSMLDGDCIKWSTERKPVEF
jgi:hypothetical protein